MINVSQAYKDAINSNDRKSYVIAKYGLYDKNAKGSINGVESDSTPFSNIYKTYNEIKDTQYNYISCEPNRVKLNNNFYFLNNKKTPNSNENLAYWSKILSDENGYFTISDENNVIVTNNTIYIETAQVYDNTIFFNDNGFIANDNTIQFVGNGVSTFALTNNNPTISFVFDKQIKFTEITLYFQEICSDFKIYYYLNDNLIANRNINNNTKYVVTTTGSEMVNDVYFNKIIIEFIKTYLPYRYVKLNEIDFGVIQTFTDKQIIDYDVIDELSIDSSELSSNSLNLVIDDTKGDFDILNPKNKLASLQERQEISMYHYLKVGNSYQELPLGTFLIKEFKADNQSLKIEAYDDIYFMNDIYYGSKFYENEEVIEVYKDLFAYFNYTNYVIDDELKGKKISGYIPNVEFREALRLIAEASKSVVSKTRYGVTFIYQTNDPISKVFTRKIIDKEKPSKNLFNNVIGIMEYNYSNVEENYELFNSTLSVGEHTIIFNDVPIKNLTLSKVDESNNNYSITMASATSCKVMVINETQVNLKATLVKPISTLKTIKKDGSSSQNQEYVIEKINNKLITNQYNEIGQWKLNRGEIKYNFNTLTIPYLEVGDTCEYVTKFGVKNTFIPTRLEFSKSIIQNIEGE